MNSRLGLSPFFLRVSRSFGPLAVVGLLWGGVCGCGDPGSVYISTGLQGRVTSGQTPVSNAVIALYTVGSAGDASAATSIMLNAVTSDATGSFNLNGAYKCPSASSLVYVVASGGDPGLTMTATNPALTMMAVVGRCDSLTSTSVLAINELTTVAATSALAGFMTSATNVGSSSTDASAFQAAFTLATELANSSTGATPGVNIPSGATVPSTKLNTLANIVASCVNTAGGVAGDHSMCGNLFALTTPSAGPSGGVAPKDTVSAMANLAASPAMNTAGVYALAVAGSPFQPQLTIQPPDFAIALSYGTLTLSSDSLSFLPTYVASPAASLKFTLSYTGTGSAGLTGTTLTGPNSAADYSELDNCPTSLAAQTSCSIWIVFTPSAAGTRVGYVSVGNSISQAVEAELSGPGVANPPQTYSAALNQSSAFMGASIVNYWPMPDHDFGVPGDVTSQMLARFQSEIIGHGYSRVIILGGSNDIIDSVPNVPAELVANLQAMGQMAQNAGMEVVLSELPPSTWGTVNGIPFDTTVVTVNAQIKQLAIENGWLVVDYYTPLVAYPQDFPDGLHPNAAGYAIMEAALAGVVSR